MLPKLTGTTKIDNILRLSINQSFDFTVGTKLVLNEGSNQRVSGYIIVTDEENNTIDAGTISVVSGNSWSNYLNVGELSTVQFSEQSSYNIKLTLFLMILMNLHTLLQTLKILQSETSADCSEYI